MLGSPNEFKRSRRLKAHRSLRLRRKRDQANETQPRELGIGRRGGQTRRLKPESFGAPRFPFFEKNLPNSVGDLAETKRRE